MHKIIKQELVRAHLLQCFWQKYIRYPDLNHSFLTLMMCGGTPIGGLAVSLGQSDQEKYWAS